LNPVPARAYARRAQRAKAIVDGADPRYAQELGNLFRTLASEPASESSDSQFRARASELLAHHDDRMAQLRGDLRMLQAQAIAMVKPEDVKTQRQRWGDWIIRRAVDEEFLRVVLAAATALYLFPDTLLQELHRRQVDVHEAVVSGYVRSFVDGMARGRFSADGYAVENAVRVLSSLIAINECDPDRVFPQRRAGTRLEQRLDHVLLVARKGRLEIRDTDGGLKGSLPGDGEFFHAAVEDVSGERMVVCADRHGVYAWEPLRTSTPSIEFAVGGTFGTISVDHRPAANGLMSAVSTLEKQIHILRDLQPVHVLSDPEGSVLDVVLTADGALYGLHQGEPRIRRWQAGRWEDVLTIPDLDRLLPALPVLSGKWTQRIAADNEALGELGPWEADAGRYQHPTLTRIIFGGEELLAFDVTLSFQDANDQVLLLLNPNDPTLTIRASYYRDGRQDRGTITAFVPFVGADKIERMATVRLSDFEKGYDLVAVARATPTRNGTALLRERSFGRTYDDLIALAMIDNARGFAADDSGGLFALSIGDSTFVELDRDRQSKIVTLNASAWQA
jgi:hypothetical protein